MRIGTDGRVRFSPWSYVDLEHVSLKLVTDGSITVVCAGTPVMYLYPQSSRILSACFLATLRPDQLRMAVADLRDARHGLDSWVVPALEFTYGWNQGPEIAEVILELLASCRDLPIAPRWRKDRARYFINQGVAPPEFPSEKAPRAKKPRGSTSKGTQRKTRRKGT
jgi:hypothetical protein